MIDSIYYLYGRISILFCGLRVFLCLPFRDRRPVAISDCVLAK